VNVDPVDVCASIAVEMITAVGSGCDSWLLVSTVGAHDVIVTISKTLMAISL
jgi:hypothetical protein